MCSRKQGALFRALQSTGIANVTSVAATAVRSPDLGKVTAVTIKRSEAEVRKAREGLTRRNEGGRERSEGLINGRRHAPENIAGREGAEKAAKRPEGDRGDGERKEEEIERSRGNACAREKCQTNPDPNTTQKSERRRLRGAGSHGGQKPIKAADTIHQTRLRRFSCVNYSTIHPW